MGEERDLLMEGIDQEGGKSIGAQLWHYQLPIVIYVDIFVEVVNSVLAHIVTLQELIVVQRTTKGKDFPHLFYLVAFVQAFA